MVAEQFIENPDNKKFIVNIDGNPENCCVENLRWSDRKYVSDGEVVDENSKWYPMDNAPNYEINKNGQVRNKIKGNILKPSLRKDGYLYYFISNYNGKTRCYAAHVLVARQFLPNPENKEIVNHIDENKQNCKLQNLEWVTHKENSQHGTSSARIGKRKEKPLNEYDLNGKYIRTWRSVRAFYEFYGIDSYPSNMYDSARYNTNNKTNMKIVYGRIFTYYTGSIENIEVNFSLLTLDRAKESFKNQDVTEEYLYFKKSAEENVASIKEKTEEYYIEINGERYYHQSVVEELNKLNKRNWQIIEQQKCSKEKVKKMLRQYKRRYEIVRESEYLNPVVKGVQQTIIEMLNEIILELEK